jgi:cation diffusion facilitator family transporter
MKATIRNLSYLEGGLSAVVNTGLFGLKLWAGVTTGSIAMIADAWHTLSDTFTSLILIVGGWISGKPKDTRHPFGHGRAEIIVAIVIGTLLGFVGLNFLRESYLQLKARPQILFGNTSLLIFGVSVVLKEGLAQFAIRAGKKNDSRALIADGWHHRSDAVASALIVIGALVGKYLWWIDGVLGILVSVLILYAAFEIFREAASVLMGEGVDHDFVRRIRESITRVEPEVSDIHHIHAHRYGEHIEVTLHVRIRGSISLNEAHETASRMEEALKKELNIEPTIHVEPGKVRKRGNDDRPTPKQ